MEGTIINSPLGKSLFQRLLISRKSNITEVIYFDKTTTENGESNNKIFDINPTIFYKPFEIEINYDITNQSAGAAARKLVSIGEAGSSRDGFGKTIYWLTRKGTYKWDKWRN